MTAMDAAPSTSWPRIRREAYPLIAGLGFASLVLAWLWAPLFWLGLAATLLAAYAFRDPERVAPNDATAILSPADGTVLSVEPAVPPAELRLGSDKRLRLVFRTGPLDARVNLAPLAGRVAELDRRSASNRRSADVQQDAFAFVGAGAVGVIRRGTRLPQALRSFVAAGDTLQAGERFGLLAFGSEVEVYLPADAVVTVEPGQTAIAGETIIARLAKPRSS